MRRITVDLVRRKRIELRQLEQDWERFNRPHINKDLRNSLYTRILELKALIQGMEDHLSGKMVSNLAELLEK